MNTKNKYVLTLEDNTQDTAGMTASLSEGRSMKELQYLMKNDPDSLTEADMLFIMIMENVMPYAESANRTSSVQ